MQKKNLQCLEFLDMIYRLEKHNSGYIEEKEHNLGRNPVPYRKTTLKIVYMKRLKQKNACFFLISFLDIE